MDETKKNVRGLQYLFFLISLASDSKPLFQLEQCKANGDTAEYNHSLTQLEIQPTTLFHCNSTGSWLMKLLLVLASAGGVYLLAALAAGTILSSYIYDAVAGSGEYRCVCSLLLVSPSQLIVSVFQRPIISFRAFFKCDLTSYAFQLMRLSCICRQFFLSVSRLLTFIRFEFFFPLFISSASVCIQSNIIWFSCK